MNRTVLSGTQHRMGSQAAWQHGTGAQADPRSDTIRHPIEERRAEGAAAIIATATDLYELPRAAACRSRLEHRPFARRELVCLMQPGKKLAVELFCIGYEQMVCPSAGICLCLGIYARRCERMIQSERHRDEALGYPSLSADCKKRHAGECMPVLERNLRLLDTDAEFWKSIFCLLHGCRIKRQGFFMSREERCFFGIESQPAPSLQRLGVFLVDLCYLVAAADILCSCQRISLHPCLRYCHCQHRAYDLSTQAQYIRVVMLPC